MPFLLHANKSLSSLAKIQQKSWLSFFLPLVRKWKLVTFGKARIKEKMHNISPPPLASNSPFAGQMESCHLPHQCHGCSRNRDLFLGPVSLLEWLGALDQKVDNSGFQQMLGSIEETSLHLEPLFPRLHSRRPLLSSLSN